VKFGKASIRMSFMSFLLGLACMHRVANCGAVRWSSGERLDASGERRLMGGRKDGACGIRGIPPEVWLRCERKADPSTSPMALRAIAPVVMTIRGDGMTFTRRNGALALSGCALAMLRWLFAAAARMM
jgi:hypothetical protein